MPYRSAIDSYEQTRTKGGNPRETEGRALLEVGGETHELVPGVWARVGPAERRSLRTEDQPARVLAVGGIPGEPYEAPDFTEEGAPDPLGSKF